VPAWTAFAAVAGLVLCVVLLLARSTAHALETDSDRSESVSPSTDRATASHPDDRPDTTQSSNLSTAEATSRETTSKAEESIGVEGEPAATKRTSAATAEESALAALSPTLLFANVLLTHGSFAAILLAAAVVADIPWSAFGVEATAASVGLRPVVLGSGLGIALYLANETLASLLSRAGVDTSESLRQALTPSSTGGWLLLLCVVLPIVAGFEELLFRAVCIGVFSTALPVPGTLLVVGSTVAFALGHGLQGPGGIIVTGLLGGVLGVAFLLSESFLLVLVAHYVVNAVELLVHEHLGVEFPPTGS